MVKGLVRGCRGIGRGYRWLRVEVGSGGYKMVRAEVLPTGIRHSLNALLPNSIGTSPPFSGQRAYLCAQGAVDRLTMVFHGI